MTSLYACDGRSSIVTFVATANDNRWASRIVVDIGYGVDIGDDDSYVTLAKRISGYFALGVEPFRWPVDIFPFRAQFLSPITPQVHA